MRINRFLRQHLAQGIVAQRDDLVDFMRGTETIKKVNKRQATVEARRLRNQRKVLRLLHVTGAQHGAAGLAYRHHVGMVAENRQCVRSDGTCGDVQNKRRQFTGQFVQRRDHQQQALRRGK
ncbi:hypothetical protein D3C79_771190 [compost metagenome]